VSVYERLKDLNIELPPLTPPATAGVYVPFLRTGNLLFLAGHIAKVDGKPWMGQLGADLSTEQGKSAARNVAIDLLGTLHAAVGDLGRIRRVLKLTVLVNSTSRFTEQHLVANGASELFAAIFGDWGMHVRSAFGAAQIPFGACVEIDLIAEVDD